MEVIQDSSYPTLTRRLQHDGVSGAHPTLPEPGTVGVKEWMLKFKIITIQNTINHSVSLVKAVFLNIARFKWPNLIFLFTTYNCSMSVWMGKKQQQQAKKKNSSWNLFLSVQILAPVVVETEQIRAFLAKPVIFHQPY